MPISLPAAESYLLANLQGLSQLQQGNSFLRTTGEQGWLWIKLHIYCSNVYPGPAAQPIESRREQIKAKYYFSKIVRMARNSSNNVNISRKKKVAPVSKQTPSTGAWDVRFISGQPTSAEQSIQWEPKDCRLNRAALLLNLCQTCCHFQSRKNSHAQQMCGIQWVQEISSRSGSNAPDATDTVG